MAYMANILAFNCYVRDATTVHATHIVFNKQHGRVRTRLIQLYVRKDFRYWHDFPYECTIYSIQWRIAYRHASNIHWDVVGAKSDAKFDAFEWNAIELKWNRKYSYFVHTQIHRSINWIFEFSNPIRQNMIRTMFAVRGWK